MEVRVFVATKKTGGGAIVGYFASEEAVPDGWRLSAEPTRDISDVMSAMRCTKAEAIKVMNSHWS